MIQIIIIPIVKEGTQTFFFLLLFRKYRTILYNATIKKMYNIFKFSYLLKTKNLMIKIKSTNNILNMIPIHEYVVKLLYARVIEKKKKKKKPKRPSYISRWGKLYNEKNEINEMAKIGYYRCNKCKSFISPDKLINDINEAVMERLAKNDKFNKHNLVECSELILNEAPYIERDIKDFKKYAEELSFINVPCRGCSRCFECDELNKVSLFDEDLINPETIIHLQNHKDRLVYVNERVVNYEHKTVN